MTPSLLVVAGEASGDRAAAHVVQALRERLSFRAFGMGGAASASAGVSLVADLRETTALGVGAVVMHTAEILAAAARILAGVRRERAKVALLVNYSEFNSRLAPRLRAEGVHVVFYGAPQVWAWRPGRAKSLGKHIDEMAVMLPFEEAIWRAEGTDARYFGHPAQEGAALSREDAREKLGLTELAKTVAILPGSRPHEVIALLPVMLAAVDRLRRDRASIDARVLLAPSLDAKTLAFAKGLAQKIEIATFHVDAIRGAGHVLPAFDVALTASGTATLEAALARAVPVVAYRVGLLTELVARALVRTHSFALPNILIDRRAFPELVQRDASPEKLANALARALDERRALLLACDEVEARLGKGRTPSLDVARMLLPWLEQASARHD